MNNLIRKAASAMGSIKSEKKAKTSSTNFAKARQDRLHKNHAYLNPKFVEHVRKHSPSMSKLVESVGISYSVFMAWINKVNRTNVNDVRLQELAMAINFNGEIFEKREELK